MNRNERLKKLLADAISGRETADHVLGEINEEIETAEIIANGKGIRKAVGVMRAGSHKVCVMIDSDECVYCCK